MATDRHFAPLGPPCLFCGLPGHYVIIRDIPVAACWQHDRDVVTGKPHEEWKP